LGSCCLNRPGVSGGDVPRETRAHHSGLTGAIQGAAVALVRLVMIDPGAAGVLEGHQLI
jgi:hypothetical protein